MVFQITYTRHAPRNIGDIIQEITWYQAALICCFPVYMIYIEIDIIRKAFATIPLGVKLYLWYVESINFNRC